MEEMLPEIEKTVRLVEEISVASNEQANGVKEVNSTIQQLNKSTQHNANSSEGLASSAENMNDLAARLKELVSFFKVDQRYSQKLHRGQKMSSPIAGDVKNATKLEQVPAKKKLLHLGEDGFERF